MIEVIASKITERKIFYNCPFCFSNKEGTKIYPNLLLKNGKEAKHRRNTIHHHGNERQTIEGNWETTRTSHCSINDEQVCIIINEQTQRI